MLRLYFIKRNIAGIDAKPNLNIFAFHKCADFTFYPIDKTAFVITYNYFHKNLSFQKDALRKTRDV